MTGEEFREMREERLRMTQSMLATCLHVRQPRISKIEAMDQVPQLYKLAIWAIVMDDTLVTQEIAHAMDRIP